MTETDNRIARDRFPEIVPPAEHQAPVPAADLLHSANAGVVVSKVGQARSEYRSEARMFAREVAKHVTGRQVGTAATYVYEESFGAEDRLHFLFHLASLDSYYQLVEMGDQDRAYRESIAKERVETETGAGAWDRLFVDGTVHSTVLLPLTTLETSGADLLHTGNAGIVLHRTATVGYGYRTEARHIGRALTEAVNKGFPGEASAILYEEAFGVSGRLHWLIHLKDLTSYRALAADDVFGEEGRPGTFVDGGIEDIALTPHHWGLYATRQQGSGS
jgi:hypothetical protein